MQEDDAPMPWEFDLCQYHKHEVTAGCERKHVAIASEWDFNEGAPGLQVQQQPRRSPRGIGGAQEPSYTCKSKGPQPSKKSAPPKLDVAVRGKLKRVKRSKPN